ncbi:MAG: D-alanyl-D-alanine carboxypeptidase/D-alanyl-D-alanine endopeptidase [Gemmatimonadaceae bacterium]
MRHTIDSLVTQPMFRTAEWAVLVVDPTLNDTLYAHNAARLMVPASNMKIVTSAVALTQLGADYRFRTTFAARGPVQNGILAGDLVVTGRGDPTLSDRVRGDARAAMGQLADSLVAHGIHSVTGYIYSGADNFPGAAVGEGWSWNDLAYDYGAGVDELLFNEGMERALVHTAAGDSVKSRPAARPTHDYLAVLDSALRTRGVNVQRGVSDSVAPQDAVKLDTLFVINSIPLREILPYFLKPSQNQIGEVLLRTVGLERTGVGTADSGIAVASRQLASWGIPRDSYVLHDGSGLSRADLVSPETLVRVLDHMQSSPDFSIYYYALPIAGVDGTIAQRMRGTLAANNVHAKTGSIQWVRSLSGYVTDASGRRLIFSALCNKYTTPSDSVTRTADTIAAILAAYHQ